MKIGGDFLGGVHYLPELLRASEQDDVAGIMLHTFGDGREAVKNMIQSKLFSTLVVHLAPFDPLHLYPIEECLPQVLKDAAWLEKQVLPSTAVFMSPFCEHNHLANDMSGVFKKLKQAAPHCVPLNSIYKGEEVSRIFTEIHLPDGKQIKEPKNPYTVSFDGFGGDGKTEFMKADILKIISYYPRAIHFRYWDLRCNGKVNWKDKTPIPNRKAWPDSIYLKNRRAKL